MFVREPLSFKRNPFHKNSALSALFKTVAAGETLGQCFPRSGTLLPRGLPCARARQHPSSLLTLPSQEYFLQAELTSDVLKTGVVRCCVGQCSNAIPVDTVLTMRKLPITYVRVPPTLPPPPQSARSRSSWAAVCLWGEGVGEGGRGDACPILTGALREGSKAREGVTARARGTDWEWGSCRHPVDLGALIGFSWRFTPHLAESRGCHTAECAPGLAVLGVA